MSTHKTERIKGVSVRHEKTGNTAHYIAECPKCDHEEKVQDQGEDSAHAAAAKIDAHILLVHARHEAV